MPLLLLQKGLFSNQLKTSQDGVLSSAPSFCNTQMATDEARRERGGKLKFYIRYNCQAPLYRATLTSSMYVIIISITQLYIKNAKLKFYVGWNCLSPLYAAPSRNFIRPTNRSQTNCGLEWIPFNKYKQDDIQIKT